MLPPRVRLSHPIPKSMRLSTQLTASWGGASSDESASSSSSSSSLSLLVPPPPCTLLADGSEGVWSDGELLAPFSGFVSGGSSSPLPPPPLSSREESRQAAGESAADGGPQTLGPKKSLSPTGTAHGRVSNPPSLGSISGELVVVSRSSDTLNLSSSSSSSLDVPRLLTTTSLSGDLVFAVDVGVTRAPSGPAAAPDDDAASAAPGTMTTAAEPIPPLPPSATLVLTSINLRVESEHSDDPDVRFTFDVESLRRAGAVTSAVVPIAPHNAGGTMSDSDALSAVPCDSAGLVTSSPSSSSSSPSPPRLLSSQYDDIVSLSRELSEATQFAVALGERPPQSVGDIVRRIVDDDDARDEESDDDDDDKAAATATATATAECNAPTPRGHAQMAAANDTISITMPVPMPLEQPKLYVTSNPQQPSSYQPDALSTRNNDGGGGGDYDNDDYDNDNDLPNNNMYLEQELSFNLELEEDDPRDAPAHRNSVTSAALSSDDQALTTHPGLDFNFDEDADISNFDGESYVVKGGGGLRRSESALFERGGLANFPPCPCGKDPGAFPPSRPCCVVGLTSPYAAASAGGASKTAVEDLSSPLLLMRDNEAAAFVYKGLKCNPPEIVKRGTARGNTVQLHRKAWLEVSDKYHRYGKNLRFYYKEWERLNYPNVMFFDWLDSKNAAAGQPLPNLKECHRGKLDSDTVLYINDPEVQTSYLISIVLSPEQPIADAASLPSLPSSSSSQNAGESWNPGGYFAGSKPESTPEQQQSQSSGPGDGGGGGSSALFLASSPPVQSPFIRRARKALSGGGGRQDESDPTQEAGAAAKRRDDADEVEHEAIFGEGWKGDNNCVFLDAKGQVVDTGSDGWIFVLRDGAMYAAPKVTSLVGNTKHRFHHSSFFGGKAVESAGIIITNSEGRLLRLYPHSGHYRPGEGHLQRMLLFLQRKGLKLHRFDVDLQQILHVGRKEAPKGGAADVEAADSAAAAATTAAAEKDKEKDTPTKDKEKDKEAKKAKKLDSLHLRSGVYVASYLANKALRIGSGLFAQIHKIRSTGARSVTEALALINPPKVVAAAAEAVENQN